MKVVYVNNTGLNFGEILCPRSIFPRLKLSVLDTPVVLALSP